MAELGPPGRSMGPTPRTKRLLKAYGATSALGTEASLSLPAC